MEKEKVGTPGNREDTPGDAEVSNAFAVAGSLAHDLVPDSADQVTLTAHRVSAEPQQAIASA